MILIPVFITVYEFIQLKLPGKKQFEKPPRSAIMPLSRVFYSIIFSIADFGIELSALRAGFYFTAETQRTQRLKTKKSFLCDLCVSSEAGSKTIMQNS
jgi:hypothetical protein